MTILQIVGTAVAVLVAVVLYLVNDILVKRRKLDGLPQPPMQNKLMGHLMIADECQRLFPKSVHPHLWHAYIQAKWDLPENFYLDTRPFGPLWLFSSDPEAVAEYMAIKQNLPKGAVALNFLKQFLGVRNMVGLEGDDHKGVRAIFNPGFSQKHLMTYAGPITTATERFIKILHKKAKTNQYFELEELATSLTIDVICLAVFGEELNTQIEPHPIATHFRERVLLMPPAEAYFPWQAVDLLRPYKLWKNNKKLESAIDVVLERRLVSRVDQDDPATREKRRSIIDLAISAYEKETALGTTTGQIKPITGIASMPRSLHRDLLDSVKTFIFAGHDTTSSTICWAHYLLHRFPEKREKAVAEIEKVFQGGNIAQQIREDPHIINKLEYITSVIKETLRIFPPASSVRSVDVYIKEARESLKNWKPTKPSLVDRATGLELPLSGAAVWPTAHALGRNPRFFPSPTHFVPERFIQSQTPFPEAELFTPAGKYAWQPFSIGTRNCIGQELAMIELRIVLAMTIKEFDFVVEYPDGQVDPQPPIPESMAAEMAEDTEYGKAIRAKTFPENKRYVEGHRVWQTLKGAAKPVDGCPGRIYVR